MYNIIYGENINDFFFIFYFEFMYTISSQNNASIFIFSILFESKYSWCIKEVKI